MPFTVPRVRLPPRARTPLLILPLLPALFGWAGQAMAMRLGAVQVLGIAGEAELNVITRLSLNQQSRDEDISDARLAYLLRRAPDEVLTALEPFGFYGSEVDVESTPNGDLVDVRISIRPGRPVQVQQHSVVVEGEGADDPALKAEVRAFRPAKGEILDHRRYAASKGSLERRLNGRGYFDAEPTRHVVSVQRSDYSADIDLLWRSGPRYAFGATRFSGNQVDTSLLQSLLPYSSGVPYSQTELSLLHKRLADLDYFGFIDIQPLTEEAQDGQVPIAVSVTPAKRSRYRAGVSYGTDTGAALRLGLERRYLNSKGHKLSTEAELGMRRRSIGAQYRIPGFEYLPGWWSISSNFREEDFGDTQSRILEVVGGRSGRWRDYTFSAEAHVLRERFDDERRDLIYPQLRVGRIKADEPLYPKHGYAWNVTLATGLSALGSDVSFTQLRADGRFIQGLGDRNRLLLRAEVGRTQSGDFDLLPPSLRFYAGGDRSVRGYGYQEIGPRDAAGANVGGPNLLVGSVEFEHMFSERWGAAAFVDAGDAFAGSDISARVGAGLGLRWRSPVGPVRLDIGVGLDDPDHALQLHINIGPDFNP